MPSYMNLIVIALAASTVSPALSAPLQNGRGQSLSHRAFLGDLWGVIKSKVYGPARVDPEPELPEAPAQAGELAEGAQVPGPTRREKWVRILVNAGGLAYIVGTSYLVGHEVHKLKSSSSSSQNSTNSTNDLVHREEALGLFSHMLDELD